MSMASNVTQLRRLKIVLGDNLNSPRWCLAVAVLRQNPRLESLELLESNRFRWREQHAMIPSIDCLTLTSLTSLTLHGELDHVLSNHAIFDYCQVRTLRLRSYEDTDEMIEEVVKQSNAGTPKLQLTEFELTLDEGMYSGPCEDGLVKHWDQILLSFRGLVKIKLHMPCSGVLEPSMKGFVHYCASLESLLVNTSASHGTHFKYSDVALLTKSCLKLRQLGIALASCDVDGIGVKANEFGSSLVSSF